MNNRAKHIGCRLSLIMAAVMLLSGCSHLPTWMGGEEKKKPREVGERIAVLPVDTALQPDPALEGQGVALPQVNTNDDWPQHGGMFSADNANLGGGAFDKIASARAGDGEAFPQTLVITPVVGGGLVFAMDAVGNISAHSQSNIENVRWQNGGLSEEDAPLIGGGGLAYDSGKLYAVSGRGLAAVFDATTGKQLWHKSLHVPFRSAPKVAGGRFFATTIDNQLYVLNSSDGELVWTQRGISETTGLMNTVSPVIVSDLVVVPYSSGEVYVLSAGDGKEVWSDTLPGGKRLQASALLASIGGDPVVDGAVVVTVSSGGTLAVKSLSSGQPAWDMPIGSTNTPWLAGNYLFVLSSDNTMVCLRKFDGHIRWSTKLPAFKNEAKKKNLLTWKGPVLVDGKIAVVGSGGQLVLMDAASGKIIATKSIPDDIYTPPVVAGGRMYLVGQDATLYSLQ